MREFFNGWKRKLGVVTLLIACAFMAGWIRSQTVNDQIVVVHEDKRHGDFFHSVDGALWWTHFDRANEASSILNQTGLTWDTQQVEPLADSFEALFEWRARWLGFRVGTLRLGAMGTAYMAIWSLPYWSIVGPLSVVSAWLMFSRTQSKPSAISGG